MNGATVSVTVEVARSAVDSPSGPLARTGASFDVLMVVAAAVLLTGAILLLLTRLQLESNRA